jgi:hypothetical protein
MVAVATGPEKREIKGSKPPAGITCPPAFVPPPNPHVWNVTMLDAGSVKVASRTLSGVVRVPVKSNADPLAVNGSKPKSRRTHQDVLETELNLLVRIPFMSILQSDLSSTSQNDPMHPPF